jgi:4-hydroxy-tetrahydrodipicolinate reductase
MDSSAKTLNSPGKNQRFRVVQWATGKVGSGSLRAIVRHPSLELVGLKVHTESKAGRDAGELCGIAPVGIKATTRIEDVIALKPDCVMYMQEGANLDEICRLLEAGINIVTTRGEFFNPDKMDAEFRRRTQAACEKGKSSIHATGSSPGFITETLPLALTSISRRLDCLTIDEFAYIPQSCSNEMIFDVMGYGRAPGAEFDPNLLGHMAQCFEQSLYTLSSALSLPFDHVETSGETAVAANRVALPQNAFIEKGTVAAQRITVAGMRNGKPLLRFRANWYCATDIEPAWHLGETGWRMVVEGDTPLDVHINFPRTEEPIVMQMAGLTAHGAVNAVPYVCVAAPGILTVSDLPRIVATLA